MIENFWGEHGQKWVLPVWWWDSKIDCFWRMNRWSKFIYACWYVITKIKSWLKLFWVGMVKNECCQSGHRAQKWIDWIKSFFSCWYEFRKAKSWFNYFWVGVVKNDHGFLVHETLRICCTFKINLWIEHLWFLNADRDAIIFGWTNILLFDF